MVGKVNVIEKLSKLPPFAAIGRTGFYQKTDRFCKKHPLGVLIILSVAAAFINLWL